MIQAKRLEKSFETGYMKKFTSFQGEPEDQRISRLSEYFI